MFGTKSAKQRRYDLAGVVLPHIPRKIYISPLSENQIKKPRRPLYELFKLTARWIMARVHCQRQRGGTKSACLLRRNNYCASKPESYQIMSSSKQFVAALNGLPELFRLSAIISGGVCCHPRRHPQCCPKMSRECVLPF